MRKKVSISIEENLLERLRDKAREENLSLSRLIENILLREVEKW